MKLQPLLTLNALLAIGFGLAFALYSPLMLAFFGIPEIPSQEPVLYWNIAAFARLFGAALLAFGLLLWALRKIEIVPAAGPELPRGVLFSLLIANIVGVFVAVTQQWQAWGGIGGWVAAGIFLLLALAYAYCLKDSPLTRS
jgi:hypothetical protein